jgi:signal transduction histidine kinase/ligand-binding sensor domain-containing protein
MGFKVRSCQWMLLFLFFGKVQFAFLQPRPLPELLFPKGETSEYVVSQWQLNDGLPQISVNALLQARSGYLWLGTFGGLVRYDGVTFHTFDRSTNPEMVSDRVIRIVEDGEGALWIGTESGLMKFKNNRFLEIPTGLERVQINQLLSDSLGTIWYSQRDGEIGYIENDSVRFVFKKTGWMGSDTRKGVYFFDSQNVLRLSKKWGNRDTLFKLPVRLPMNVRYFAADLRTNWWFVSNDSGLYRYRNSKLELINASGGLPSSYANFLLQEKDSSLLVLTNRNIYRIKNDTIQTVKTVSPLPEGAYGAAAFDREENLWLGSQSEGLFRLRKSYFTNIGRNRGMNIQNLLSLTFDRNKTLWYSTNCEGVGRYKNGIAENMQASFVLQNNCPWAILRDLENRFYVASRGITIFDSTGASSFFDVSSGLTSNTIRALYQMPDSTIWAGTTAGITIFKQGKPVMQLPHLGKLEHPDVRVLHRAQDGSVWAGTSNGLVHIEGERITVYDKIPGLNSHYFRSIANGLERSLWFGTYGGGLIRLKNDVFTVLTVKDGLFDNIVSHLLDDGLGYFWSGSNRGIARMSISQLEEVADRVRDRIQPQILGKQHGMQNVETNGGFQPSAIKGPDGVLYFPTIGGIAAINPAAVETNRIVPEVYIEKVVHNTVAVHNPVELVYDYHPFFLEIHYTALSFIDPTKVKFRYKLEGYDRDWVDAGGRRTAFYSNLPPGIHAFRVIASNNDGLWNETGAKLAIVIHPPFWLTGWFIALSVGLLSLIAFSLYAARISQLKRREQIQQQFAKELITSQENERRRIAHELHDGVGHHMMMIKNSLRTLEKSLGVAGHHKMFKETLENTEAAITELRGIAQDLRPVHLERFGLTETLRHMLAGIITSTDIEVTAEIDELDASIEKGLDIHLYRLVQEALNNVLKHSKATELSVSVRLENGIIEIIVTDNGAGFVVASQNQGSGLHGMEERTRLLGGRFYIHSLPGQGTYLQFLIPTRV